MYEKLSKKTGKLRVTIIPIRVKKMFKGGEEAGVTNVLHVNAEYNKDFQSHELITTACEKADLKGVFNRARPKGWAVTNVSPKDLAKLIVKAAKHMLPKVRCCRAPMHCRHTHWLQAQFDEMSSMVDEFQGTIEVSELHVL